LKRDDKKHSLSDEVYTLLKSGVHATVFNVYDALFGAYAIKDEEKREKEWHGWGFLDKIQPKSGLSKNLLNIEKLLSKYITSDIFH